MPEIALTSLPELFVSNTKLSGLVRDALARGQIRKLGSRHYSRNLEEDPERLIKREPIGSR